MARRKQFRLAVLAAAPHRADRVDHPPRREPAGSGCFRVADVAAAEQAALLQDRRPARAVDRPVHSPTTEQARVRGVDDRVDGLRRDVAARDLDQPS
jgi:hypothetical protein